MKLKPTIIEGVYLIFPDSYKDKRGLFFEVYKIKSLKKIFSGNFVQENRSISTRKWTFRGMHFQKGKHAQDKLISITKGSVIDFIFDLRSESKSYKKFLDSRVASAIWTEVESEDKRLPTREPPIPPPRIDPRELSSSAGDTIAEAT